MMSTFDFVVIVLLVLLVLVLFGLISENNRLKKEVTYFVDENYLIFVYGMGEKYKKIN